MSMSEAGRSGKLKIVGDVGTIVVNEGTGAKASPAAADAQPKKAPGFDEGYKKGWDERGAKAQAEIAALKSQLDGVSRQIPEAISAYFKEFEEQAMNEVCEIAFVVARIIIGREFDADPEAVHAAIVDALSPLVNPQGVKLRLNPAVADMVSKSGMEGVPSAVAVVPDSSLGIGDVVVDCQQGIIDGTIDGRMRALKDFICKSLGSDRQPR